jgi:predicted RNA-binding protein associated with RNAse of E/G family
LYCKAGLSKWKLVDATWSRGATVLLIRPTEAHAIHIMWDNSHQFVGWYVNLQEPLRRTKIGSDFLDQELDIVVKPNFDWQWKDPEHLDRAEEIGLFTHEQAKAIREEGLRVLGKIKAKAEPFDTSWTSWRLPSDWKVPSLLPHWDKVEWLDG